MTDEQIGTAAALWNQGLDTFDIAGRLNLGRDAPWVWNRYGCAWPAREAIVYNRLGLIREAARKQRHKPNI